VAGGCVRACESNINFNLNHRPREQGADCQSRATQNLQAARSSPGAPHPFALLWSLPHQASARQRRSRVCNFTATSNCNRSPPKTVPNNPRVDPGLGLARPARHCQAAWLRIIAWRCLGLCGRSPSSQESAPLFDLSARGVVATPTQPPGCSGPDSSGIGGHAVTAARRGPRRQGAQ